MHHGDMASYATHQTLGRYRLLRLIGRGGMGEVWLAEDPRLHRQVAIKTLPTHSQDDREFLLRFEREAQAAAALNHPHILPVYDYGDQPVANGQSITYLVMPLVSGGSLSNRISAFHRQQMQMPPQEALQHLMQAAEAIDYAHDQGIIHRDIKPGNILMRSENWLLLADFGIAHLRSSREHLTRTGESFGTPEYMSPEQARGKAVPSSDNYSLAVIAFYLLAGRLPFKADMPYATTIQHLTMPPPSPRQFNPSLPLAAEAILLQGLAKYPAQRPPSCRAFVGELQRAMDDSNSSTVIRVHPVPGQPSSLPPRQDPELPDTGVVKADSTTVSQPDVPDQPTSQPQPTPPASPAIKRRNLLIGGAASLVTVGGGLALWRILSQSHPRLSTPTSSPTPTPTPDPLAPVMILRGHNSPIWNLAFSPAQNSLALASTGKEDQFVLLWDIQKLQKQASPSTPIDRYTVKKTFISTSPLICWSRDGKYLAIGHPEPARSAFDETTMTVYTGDLNAPAPGFTTPVTVTGSNTLEGITWYQDKYVVIGNNLSSSLANPNGKNQFQIGVVDTTQTQPQWTATTFDGYLPLSFGDKTNSFPLAGSPDGSLLALTNEQTVMVGALTIMGKTLTWQQKQDPLRMDNTSFSNKFSTVIWSPSGDKIGAIYGDTIVVWEWKTGNKQGFTLKLDNKRLTAIAWSPTPSSGLVAGGTDDGTVAIWDTTEKNLIPVKTFNTGNFKTLVSTLAWSADGQWLAAGLQDNYGSIAIWMYS